MASVAAESDIPGLPPPPATREARFYLWDHLGTIRVIMKEDLAAPDGLEFHDYEPFGVELRPILNQTANTHQYTGHERDLASGYDYMHFRYYGSNLGRFMKPDDGCAQRSESLESWNLYSYVRGNPLGLDDPTGHIDPAMADWNRSVSKQDIQSFQEASAHARPAPGTEVEQAILAAPVAIVGVITGLAVFELAGPALFGLSAETVANVEAGTLIGSVSGAAQNIQQGQNPTGGIITGALAGAATGNVPSNALVQSAVASGSANLATQYVTTGKVDVAQVAGATIAGAGTGTITTTVEAITGQAASPVLAPTVQGVLDNLQTHGKKVVEGNLLGANSSQNPKNGSGPPGI